MSPLQLNNLFFNNVVNTKLATSDSLSPIKFNTLFAKQQDPVIKILDSFKEKATDSEYVDPDESNSEASEDVDKARKANYELFMSKATVVPKLKDNKFYPVKSWRDTKNLLYSIMTEGLI